MTLADLLIPARSHKQILTERGNARPARTSADKPLSWYAFPATGAASVQAWAMPQESGLYFISALIARLNASLSRRNFDYNESRFQRCRIYFVRVSRALP